MSEKKKEICTVVSQEIHRHRYLQHVAADRTNRSRSQAGTVCVFIQRMIRPSFCPDPSACVRSIKRRAGSIWYTE